MDMKNFFRFENPDDDFPFYNDNPKLEKKQWLLLLGGMVVFLIFMAIPLDLAKYIRGTIIFLIMIIPIAVVTRGKLGYLFKRPKAKDLLLIIVLLIAYAIYSLAMMSILFKFGIKPTANEILSANMDGVMIIGMFLQLIGEELVKIIPFLMITYALYRHSQNRKLAITLALVITLILFGLIHFRAYSGNFAQMILIIGFGSFFNMFAYLKTKNATVSYIFHIIWDFTTIILVMMAKFEF